MLKNEPAIGAVHEGHVPKYKTIWEDTSGEYVMPDYKLSYGMPQHLMTRDEQWDHYPGNERRGGKFRHERHMEDNGVKEREVKERYLESQWIKGLDRNKRAEQ